MGLAHISIASSQPLDPHSLISWEGGGGHGTVKKTVWQNLHGVKFQLGNQITHESSCLETKASIGS